MGKQPVTANYAVNVSLELVEVEGELTEAIENGVYVVNARNSRSAIRKVLASLPSRAIISMISVKKATTL